MKDWTGSIWLYLKKGNDDDVNCFILLDEYTILWENGEIVSDSMSFKHWRVYNRPEKWKQLA